MILAVDASNLQGGGGVNHLRQLLAAADPRRHGFEEVLVWGNTRMLSQLPERDWLTPVPEPLLDRPMPFRLAWQYLRLPSLVAKRADVLFAPGGSVRSSRVPFVTMSRNMLPFEAEERRRYGFSISRMRLWVLRRAQLRTFERADGVIFLSDHARRAIERSLGRHTELRTIPHGVSSSFRDVGVRSPSSRLRLLYVSPIKPYKHQWNVVEAVSRLRQEGWDAELDLVGRAEPASYRKLEAALRKFDPAGSFVRYHGEVAHGRLADHYREADAFVFASTCENLPNVLLEAMAAGLPIASSDRGPMPDVLGDDGLYFDPEDVSSVVAALRVLASDPVTRAELARRSAGRAASLPRWEDCADATFGFLADVARRRPAGHAAENGAATRLGKAVRR